MRKLFGTDGIRGVANEHPMTTEIAMQLGRAVAHIFKNKEGRHRILIGKDTRVSGYMLETALASGVCSMGVDVLIVGPMPTPALAFLTVDMRCDAGVMITASHNPYQDNGIKFFGHDGFKLPDEIEMEIENLIASGDIGAQCVEADEVGQAERIDDVVVVVRVEDRTDAEHEIERLAAEVDVVVGGASRQESELAGLRHLADLMDLKILEEG